MKAPPSEMSQLLQLLAYPFPAEGRSKPGSRFTAAAWGELKEALQRSGRERDPLSGDDGWVDALATPERPAEWYRAKLRQAGALAFETTKLADAGAWLTTIDDPAYPRKLRERLGSKAPLLLLGAGPASLANRKAAAFVGSREADEAALAFTREAVRKAVNEDYVICSGGAKGVDRTAEEAALEANGNVVLYLTEGILHALRDKRFRAPVTQGRALLLSGHPPKAPWSVGLAMARNKLIHAHADFVVVAASSDGEGGTWEGVTENLREGWSPVAVRADPGSPPGNDSLLARGALPLRTEQLRGRDSFRRVLLSLLPTAPSKVTTLEDLLRAAHPAFVGAANAAGSFEEFAARAGLHVQQARKWGLEATFTPARQKSEKPRAVKRASHDCFELIWPSVHHAIEARGEDEARKTLGLHGPQLSAWKKRAATLSHARARLPKETSLDQFGS